MACTLIGLETSLARTEPENCVTLLPWQQQQQKRLNAFDTDIDTDTARARALAIPSP